MASLPFRIATMSLITWTFAVTLSRSLRRPLEYAEAQWLLDYRFGFVKRGLMGELFTMTRSLFHAPATEELIFAVSASALVVFSAIIFLMAYRILQDHNWSANAIAVVLVFASSPFVVMSANAIGYYDNIVIMLGLASLLLLRHGKPLPAALVQAVALLVHENAFLITYPLFLFAYFFTRPRADRKGVLHWATIVLPVLVFGLILLWQDMFLSAEISERQTSYLSQYAFLKDDKSVKAPQFLGLPFRNYLMLQSQFFFKIVTSPAILFLLIPGTLAIVFHIVKTAQRRLSARHVVLLVSVILAPQAMHLVAWDGARISTFSLASAFVMLWFMVGIQEHSQGSTLALLLCLIAIVINVVIDVPVMLDAEHHGLNMRLILYLPTMVAMVAVGLMSTRKGDKLIFCMPASLRTKNPCNIGTNHEKFTPCSRPKK